MPFRPMQRCSFPGCAQLVKSGRCSTHTTKHSATTGQRGYDGRHKRASQSARADQPWCSWCGTDEDLTADHVDPTDPNSPLQVLCRPCNTRRMNMMRRR